LVEWRRTSVAAPPKKAPTPTTAAASFWFIAGP
jgi:hypothetical protein